ncbi:MAG: formate dehydrogenase accessory protein FdhE [Desulfacinum sp.]|jgi:FdhE protein|nr:formate dehydrogenase accessory protein FdhE [Desulfacinum sp.]
MDPVLDKAVSRRPVLEPILRAFWSVHEASLALARALEDRWRPEFIEVDARRLREGVPVLVGHSLQAAEGALEGAFRGLIPVLGDTFPHLRNDLDRMASLHDGRGVDLASVCRAYLEGDLSGIGRAFRAAGVEPGSVLLVLHETLSAALKSLDRLVGQRLPDADWWRGYCPLCGALPVAAYLAEGADPGSRFLSGGGGQRYLHCAVCGHDWRFPRRMCPACGTEDKDVYVYFQVEGEPAERVDVCGNCGGYLPCIDYREAWEGLPVDLAVVAMLHLDMWACLKGYHPLMWTPWNGVGPCDGPASSRVH